MTTTHTKRRPATWLIVAAVVAVLFCCAGTITAVVAAGDPPASAPSFDSDVHATTSATPSKAPTPPKNGPSKKAPPATPVIVIDGDDIVHVGEDVPAGTYRAVEDVEGLCYWLKSRDSEGAQIIDNGLPRGGQPQVTLKNGQWFTSQGCPDWRKK